MPADDPACLNVLHSTSEESGTHEAGRWLAEAWGLECWVLTGGLPLTLRRLA